MENFFRPSSSPTSWATGRLESTYIPPLSRLIINFDSSRAGKDIFSSRWRGRPSCWQRGGEEGSGHQGKLVKVVKLVRLVRLVKLVNVVKLVKGKEELEMVKGVAGLRRERGGREI